MVLVDQRIPTSNATCQVREREAHQVRDREREAPSQAPELGERCATPDCPPAVIVGDVATEG